MTKPTIRIHNTETNEVIDREMTTAEYAQYEADQSEAVSRQSKIEQTKTTKIAAEAKLAALGFTADDLKALGL